MGIETLTNNHIPVSCGACYVVGKLRTCVCRNTYFNIVQSISHTMLYGNDFGPNYSKITTRTTHSPYHISK